MLHLFVSNRYEALREQLLDDLAATPADPFASRDVIVASSAIKRDLRLALATRQGVCAGMNFPYLAQWLWQRFAQLVAVQPVSPFSPARLCWRLYRLFGDTAQVAGEPRLGSYLVAADPVMRLELAQQVATLFEQYITYRPDWLAAWRAGKTVDLPQATPLQQQDAQWQATLWRQVTDEMGTSQQHPSEAFLERVAAMSPTELQTSGLPDCVFLFALPTLPPLYLRILEQLSDYMDIRLYLLNPCQEYWFEIVDPKRLCYLQQQGRGTYRDSGNPLLAAWGKQSQALFDLLLDDTAGTVLEDSQFVPAHGTHLLAQLQNRILNLEPLTPGSLTLAGTGLDDRSLEIHVCHSLTRELEVLHDQLLACLHPQAATTGDPLHPADILVALPDLESAAPLIDAVFGTAGKLPYIITGRSEQRTNPVAAALLALLETASGRLNVNAVFGLLRHRLIADNLSLEENDIERIHRWLLEAGVHWGTDAEHRASLGLPAETRHTWRDGLSRLLLGYALPDRVETFTTRQASDPALLAPAGHAEGSGAQALGALWQLLERLEQLRQQLAEPRPASDWIQLLQGILERDLHVDGHTIEDWRTVQATLHELGQQMTEGLTRPDAQDSTPVPATVLHTALASALDQRTRGGVPTGAITFTALPSLRLLPYRIICLLGMNDGAFPGLNRAAEFDLLPLEYRRGDRQRRLDDRNLFLDLLLAARERFYLGYTGKSQRDDSPFPPSVLVSELLDTVLQGLGPEVPATRLVVTHPLQAFSLHYFADGQRPDPRLYSFDQEMCAALREKFRHLARQAAEASSGLPPSANLPANPDDDEEDQDDQDIAVANGLSLPAFFTEPLPPPEAVWQSVTLAQLLEFLRHPARYLLQRRLGLRLDVDKDVLSDEEPFLLDWQGEQALAERLLPAALEGEAVQQLCRMAVAGQEVPAGPLGHAQAGQESRNLHQFATTLSPHLQQATCPPLRLELACPLHGPQGTSTWTLHAELHDLRPDGLIGYRYDDTRPRDYLTAWLHHLCLCAATTDKQTGRATRWYSRNGHFSLLPLEHGQARQYLGELIRLYRQGLMQPLPLPLKTAWAYCTSGHRAALQRWRGSPPHLHGERDAPHDPCWRLALRGQEDSLPHDLDKLAGRVFGPLLDHLEDARLRLDPAA